jgi:Tol biopolymer transport system component
LPLILALTAFLLLGMGFWFYKTRSPNNENKTVTPLAPQQLKTQIFTTTGGVPHRVTISPDGKTLAYVGRFKGLDSLWLGEIETSNSVQITPASDRLYSHLAFAPDGKTLYFTARDDNHLIWTLMRVSIFGGATQDLITSVHSSISFSPDGKQIAFLRKHADADQTSIVITDTETGKNEQILMTREKGEKFVGEAVAWSPDGKTIAVWAQSNEKENGILAINIESGEAEKNGNQTASGANLVWLRDGSGLLAIIGTSGETGDSQIWSISYPQGEGRKITNDALSYLRYCLSVSDDNKIAVLQARSDPKIWAEASGEARAVLEGARTRAEGMHGLAAAPDGKILYTARTRESHTIWEMNADGTNQRQLTASQKDSGDNQINITSDGRYLVFESHRSGSAEIWRSNRNGGNLKQLTDGGGNSQPAVSPDGNWIIYTANRAGKSTLWRISIEGGEPQQLTTEETAWADISPDGKFIACAHGKPTDSLYKRIAVYPAAGGEKPIKTFAVSKHGIMYNRLRWSPDGKAIVYKDIVRRLWRQDLDKDKPEAFKGFDDLRVFHFAFAGKDLIYSGGIPMREIVILENFN